MHPNTIFPEPVFITRLIHIDPQFAEDFRGQKSFLVTANFFTDNKYRRLAQMAREGCDILIVNPVTNFFTYSGYVEKPTYSNLPYAPELPFSRTKLKEIHRTNFIDQVVAWQVNHGAGLLIAPYFYARDLDDRKYDYNLNLLEETICYKDKYGKQVWACINMGIKSLFNENLNEVIDNYCKTEADGFFILLEGFEDRSATTSNIITLLTLVEELSRKKDVIVGSIGPFGQILFAYGANGFSSGIGWMETFRESQLEGGEVGYAADRVPRAQYYYISSIFSYVKPYDLATLMNPNMSPEDLINELKCDCVICEEGYPKKPMDKKRHFLHKRFEEMRTLRELLKELDFDDMDTRKNTLHEIMMNKLLKARFLAQRIQDEVFIDINIAGINNWIEALKKYPPSSF
ncbi:MAG: hypothetical protein HQ591_01000 [candidate division Zixibacteria bacterium]|nr:hypothetical protein [Candidatus Tariuqbacter arcticus]